MSLLKKTLSWILSVQMAGLSYLIPVFLVAGATTSLTLNAGSDVVVPVQPVLNEKDQPVAEPPPGMETITHAPPAEPKPKKYLCKKDDGSWKTGCIIAGVLLGIAAIVLIAKALKKNKKPVKGCYKGKCGGGGGGGNKPPVTEEPPTNPPNPGPGPKPVPCCQNPAPAPAPGNGGITETSTVTTGNTPVDGVTPTVINPD